MTTDTSHSFSDVDNDRLNHYNDDDLIEILYNNSYGGFCISDQALKLYNKYTGKTISNDTDNIEDRSDPVLVQIYHELGKNFNGIHILFGASNIQINGTFEKKYIKYIDIHMYTGAETIIFDRERYYFDKIKEAIDTNTNDNELLKDKVYKILYFR